MLTDIARIRRFNRAVTTETGALDDSFLGRGRPLGAARVLNAIGQAGAAGRELGDVRDFLGLDSGLLSRLLRGLEAEGLVSVAPHPEDGRKRLARLTEAGLAEFAAYEKLSDDRAAQLLAHHPRPRALLDAMDLVASALGQHRIEVTEEDPQSDESRYCLGEYYAELGRRFAQGFDVNLSRDPDAASMRAPIGSFLVARSDGLPVGCVGLKGGQAFGEVKRLWVAPSARGLRLATRLMDELESRARQLGMAVLRLDTNSALPEAVAMYRNAGWTEIDRFNDDPYPDHFFEKAL
ncbi:helix-turn-helix domain-containing GNAT family N-acetyltransferase [Vannielia litorea]|uniref:Transcriptional regulator, MarR family with acetyltransferase activity n=1 Tax=Vannielia litorea TaxID=1217970 RepID=A0A1N6DXJ1_9RHOB|nr:helix-turn-helix domain-containing GNAT family N-acetyltransferase [Vannielia litorea]SIN75485.1 transcriptional regulator, MarR family with acetyltransferase activity [Vannielia litorea]